MRDRLLEWLGSSQPISGHLSGGSSRRAVMRTIGLMLLGFVFLWWSPLSPLALYRADNLIGEGRVESALEHYDAVARRNPFAGLRHRAMRRAATLWSVDGRDPSQARLRLQQLAESDAPTEWRAQAWEDIGYLYIGELQQPEEAAAAFYAAYQLERDQPASARRLLAAARARSAMGDLDGSFQLWDIVATRYDADRPLAFVSQAGILLAKDHTRDALELYERVLGSPADEDVLHVARLGAATCKERMGMFEAALAEIGNAGLPDSVRSQRTGDLKDRADHSR